MQAGCRRRPAPGAAIRLRPYLVGLGALLLAGHAVAQQGEDLVSSPLAAAFGAAPRMSGARLSPDGRKVSYLQTNEEGRTLLGVLDLDTGQVELVLAGELDRFTILWCGWANETRLLCSFRAVNETRFERYSTTRLVAVNADGSDALPLLQGRLGRYGDTLIDWLPDDPDKVLALVPAAGGYATARLDIYDATLEDVTTGAAGTLSWGSDGRGQLRVYVARERGEYRFYVRGDDAVDWKFWRAVDVDDRQSRFVPQIIEGNAIYYLDADGPRTSLFSVPLDLEREPERVFTHERVDVLGVQYVGKYDRLVGAGFAEETFKIGYFDDRIADLVTGLEPLLEGRAISVVDEDWQRQNYLVFAASDTDPGSYYHFDAQSRTLTRLAESYPALAERSLRPMRPLDYPARDGTTIPGYLTLPEAPQQPPAVVLPHGGPWARDYWGYDFLVQYLAARGYAVLQSNYRGSAGYGEDWVGRGAYREWRRAVSDVADGARYLIDAGLVDPERVCIVGWSFGGYLALQSVIAEPDLYACAASIAGFGDLRALAQQYTEQARENLGIDRSLYATASPQRRADEIDVPVLLVHGKWDFNVSWHQSRNMARALRRLDRPVELVSYEKAEHEIAQQAYRIDLLTRLGRFLDESLAKPSIEP